MYVRNFPEAGINAEKINVPKNYGGVYFSKKSPKNENDETVTKIHSIQENPLPPKKPLVSRERIQSLQKSAKEINEFPSLSDTEDSTDNTESPPQDSNDKKRRTTAKTMGDLPINPEDLLIASVITALLREGKGDLLPLELALLLIT